TIMENSESLTEKVFKGSSIVLAFALVGTPIGYLIRVLYSYTLSIEMFGLFYAVLAFFLLISTYLDFGLGFSVAYFIPKFLKQHEPKKVAYVFKYYQILQLTIALVTASILLLTAEPLAQHYFKSAAAVPLIYLFCMYLIFNNVFNSLNAL